MKKLVMYTNSSASAQWRLQDPAKYMDFEVRFPQEGIKEEDIRWADSVTLQGCIDKDAIAMIAYYKDQGKKVVLEQDDRIVVEDDNPHKKQHDITGASKIIEITAGMADMITCTTPYLADNLKQYNDNVVVLPNYMDMKRWDLPDKHANTNPNQIRIGYFGSITHLEDIKMILPALHKIYKEFPNVMFVFVGDPRIADLMEGLPSEVMMGVPFDGYPAKLHSLSLDIAIAPLRDSEFNLNKSAIKFYEASIAHYPMVASDTIYKWEIEHDKTGLLSKDINDWYINLKRLMLDKELCKKLVTNAYKYVKENKDLEKRIYKFNDAYNSLFD
jgi:glycosyltransferase involved in cell wall biosynthesis